MGKIDWAAVAQKMTIARSSTAEDRRHNAAVWHARHVLGHPGPPGGDPNERDPNPKTLFDIAKGAANG